MKKQSLSPENNFGVPDINSMSLTDARSYYRKMLNQTSYQRQFGEPPKAEEEFLVLKTKKFSQLEISRFFKKEVQGYIQNWLDTSPSESQISLLYFTAREIYTFIKQAQYTDSSYSF